MTYHLTTFGCQMNYSDSERIAAVFENMNIKSAEQNKADILIFNLCSVRQHAVDRMWGLIKGCHPEVDVKSTEGSRGKHKKIIILTGCILQADKNRFKDKVDLILDIKNLSMWPLILQHYFADSPRDSSSSRFYIGTPQNDNPPKDYFSIQPSRFSMHTAYVPIMTGCNNFCSYCAVPYTRGQEYSRPVADIVNEVNKLVVQGYREIILLGQNVNSYQDEIGIVPSFSRRGIKKSLDFLMGVVTFPILLKLIDSIPGDHWLSFLTSHPKDISDELIKCFKDCKHLMPYLHLPLQSGSDKILKAMNRNYTAKQYLDLIRGIRKAIRNISISTDIIVGFPGETKKDFLATAELMKKIKLDMAYLAEYSPRPGTAAAKLKDSISRQEKTKRKNYLNEILKKTALENNQKLVGKTETILVESIKNNFAFGQTKMKKNVKINMPIVCHSRESGNPEIKNKRNLIGQFIKVKITKAGAWGTEGEIKRESSW